MSRSNSDCCDCQEFTLEVISGEKVVEEIRTITGIPGDGTRNDLMSVRMALALGCRIGPCKIEHYRIGSDGKPLEIIQAQHPPPWTFWGSTPLDYYQCVSGTFLIHR